MAFVQPSASVDIVSDHAPPCMVGEFYPVTITVATEEEAIEGGALRLTLLGGDAFVSTCCVWRGGQWSLKGGGRRRGLVNQLPSRS